MNDLRMEFDNLNKEELLFYFPSTLLIKLNIQSYCMD